MSRPQLKKSLFEKSKKLEIIPADFLLENFSERFFYLFIERFNSEHRTDFHENLFTEKYAASMLPAFDFSFAKLLEDRKFRIDIAFLDQLYDLASTAINDTMRGYRDQGSTASFDAESATKAYMQKFIKDGYQTKLFLLPEIVVGRRLKGLHEQDAGKGYKNLSIFESYVCNHLQVQEIRAITTDLINIYYTKIDEINGKQISEEESQKQKIELISTFIGDLCRFHGRKDGNGRLGCFLLLNFLLIQENLTPAMVFHPWLLVYALPHEAAIITAEGQKAFEEFFVKGGKIEPNPRACHLGLDLQKLTISQNVNADEITRGVFDLFFSYLEIKEFEKRSDLFGGIKKNFLDRKKSTLKDKVDELSQIEELRDFSFPIPTNILLFVTVMRAAISFNEGVSDKTTFDDDDLKYSFQNLTNFFREVGGVEISYKNNHDSLNLLEKMFQQSPDYAELQNACTAFLQAARDFCEIFSQVDDKNSLSFSEILQVINGQMRPLFNSNDRDSSDDEMLELEAASATRVKDLEVGIGRAESP